MIAQANNPAAKLHNLLERARDQNPNELTWKVWANTLQVKAGEPADIFLALVKVRAVLEEIEGEVLAEADHRIVLFEHFPMIRRIVSPSNLEAPWQISRQLITPEILYSLRILDLQLKKNYPVDNPAETVKVKNRVAELMSEIESGELDAPLKNMLLARLEHLLKSIEDFQLVGASDVAEDAQILSAIAIVHNEEFQKAPSTKKQLVTLSEVIQHLTNFCKTGAALYGLKDAGQKLIDRLMQ